MARPGLRAISIALALAAVGCNHSAERPPEGSVTVKLPPARPPAAAPAFSFNAQDKAVTAKEH